jgi:hypothetical protein
VDWIHLAQDGQVAGCCYHGNGRSFQKMRVISWLPEGLLVSEEGLFPMEVVSQLVYLFSILRRFVISTSERFF